VESEIEIDTLKLVVELNEAEKPSARTERVLEPAGSLDGCEPSG
jgi:hypothetical protein